MISLFRDTCASVDLFELKKKKKRDRKRLEKLIERAGSTIGISV